MQPSGDNRIDGSSSVSQPSSVAQDAHQPWLYSPLAPAPEATRTAEHDSSSDARMEDTPPVAVSRELMSSVQVGLGLHLGHELTPLTDDADEDELHIRGRTTLESMFADDSNRRNSDPSRGLEGISIGEGSESAGGGGGGALGAGGSFGGSGSGAETPVWPSSADSSVPSGESSSVQASLVDAEPESADAFATAEASASATASAPASRAASSVHLSFQDGLDGWTVSQSGGSQDGQGSVTIGTAIGGSAVLHEGDSFQVTLQREIVIPDDPVAIEFVYIASFDTTDQDSIKDAFKVALTDSDGYSLVDTFTTQRDAYFNLTEGLPAALGASVTHEAVSQGHQVTLDISKVPPGTEATLIFRLVNNDTDTETTVTILSVGGISQANSSISGYVYLDVNNNGIKEPWEQGLPNVPITLGGTVTQTVVTAADKSYRFDELPPGTYEIVQTQPLAFNDGRDTQGTPLLGSVENNLFYDIQLEADVHAVNYNFGELGLRAPFIGKHLLLASTPPAGQLLAEMMVPEGDWYVFPAAESGTATVSVPANVSEPVIQIYTADMKPVAMSEGEQRLTAPVQQGQQYVLHVSGQGGEAEFVPTLQYNWTLPPDTSPLVGRTNPLNPLDVNGDGLVTPQDVLMVINHLNASRPPAASSAEGEAASVHSPRAAAHLVGTALDARSQVVLHAAEGEGSSSALPLGSSSTASPSPSVLTPGAYTQHLAGQSLLLTGTANIERTTESGGTLVPNRIAAVLVNGVGVEVLDAAGNFFTQVDVLPGENVFHVTAIDAYGQTAETMVTVFGSDDPGGHVDLLFDVSPSFEPLYARTSFDERVNLLFAELAIRNVGQYPADNPFYVGVRNISDPTVTVRETVGTTRDGTPYYNFSQVLPGDSLAPEGVTGFVSAVFHNSDRVQFSYDLVFLAKLNEPPVFTTVPIVETHAGWTYRYDAQATDPDGDPLIYSLLSGPQFMTVNEATGQVNWLPAESDLGVHPVILHVHDGRGGSAEQRYLLSVTETPPNRPPYFVSVSVTEATVSTDGEATYHYDAVAIDPDLDPLTYSLVEHPQRMTIDATTGVIRWAPTLDQLRDHDLIVQASDGRGGVAQQEFIIRVTPDSLNRPPFFVSVPPTTVAIRDDQPAAPFRYEAIAIDPDEDPVTYALVDGPDGMTMDSTTGLLSWDAPPELLQRHGLQLFDGDFLASDWEQTAYYIGRTGSTSVRSHTSGGNPDAYQRITTGVAAASTTRGNQTYSIHRYTPVTVYPAEFGTILSISYSEDIRFFSGRPQRLGIALFSRWADLPWPFTSDELRYGVDIPRIR